MEQYALSFHKHTQPTGNDWNHVKFFRTMIMVTKRSGIIINSVISCGFYHTDKLLDWWIVVASRTASPSCLGFDTVCWTARQFFYVCVCFLFVFFFCHKFSVFCSVFYILVILFIIFSKQSFDLLKYGLSTTIR